MIIAGAGTLITLLLSVTTSTLTLVSKVQTATIVNPLAKNGTNVLILKEDLYRWLEESIDTLYGVLCAIHGRWGRRNAR